MQITRENVNPTTIKLSIVADEDLLAKTKAGSLSRLGRNLKVQGFRPGKAPQHLIEKNLDPALLQSDFLEQAVNDAYVEAIRQEELRPVVQPQINITKFVPFTTLEFTAEVEVVGEIKLPDYKKVKLAKKPVKVTAEDVNKVIENLQTRVAEKADVDRAAKKGDEVLIDFAGTDAKTKEPIQGADGKDYPLQLGSDTFIPGFEDNLIGVKPGKEKTFDLTFPADYGVATLQNRKVTFAVTIKKVQEMKLPKVDDAFAASVGPFKTVADLKADIKKQLESEQTYQNQREFDNELIEKIAEKAKVAIPKLLIDEEIDRLEDEEKRNLAYRGQTWQEHLDEEGVNEEEHREKKREAAELRVKAGLVLSEIANEEKIDVTPEELEIRIQLLKGQYSDAAMQAELDKPEARRQILSGMLSEKTMAKLNDYATAK